MRTRIIASAILAAAVIVAAVITLAMRHPATAAHTRTAVARHVARASANCPAVLRAVSDVARKAHIDLSASSMTGHVVRNEELAWSAELLRSWKQSAQPTAADIRLG